jgi:hypothetical protein
MVYRFLRTLEGLSPPLTLTHLSCQTTAKAFTATRMCLLFRLSVISFYAMLVFDRMFSLGVRGSGTETAPLGARVAAAAGAPTGPRRHFLYCSLKPEPTTRSKRSKEFF